MSVGIDTNVLLRFYEQDNPDQTARARDFVRRNAPVFVNDIVLVEFVWVCKSHFNLNRNQIGERLLSLVQAWEFQFASPDSVERAIEQFINSNRDFADLLIGESNKANGCTKTFTFDAGATKSDTFSLIEAKP